MVSLIKIDQIEPESFMPHQTLLDILDHPKDFGSDQVTDTKKILVLAQIIGNGFPVIARVFRRDGSYVALDPLIVSAYGAAGRENLPAEILNPHHPDIPTYLRKQNVA